ETGKDWNRPSSSSANCSLTSSGTSNSPIGVSSRVCPLILRSTTCKSSVASAGGANGVPDRSDSDLCKASNIRLMFGGSGGCGYPRFSLAGLQFLQVIMQQEQSLGCAPRVPIFVAVRGVFHLGLMNHSEAEVGGDVFDDVWRYAVRLSGVARDQRVFADGVNEARNPTRVPVYPSNC